MICYSYNSTTQFTPPPPHIINDHVQPREMHLQVLAQVLDGRNVSQVNTEYMKAVLPHVVIILLAESNRSVSGKSAGCDHHRAAPQQLQTAMESYLDSPCTKERLEE